jgi:hypothetical protein
MGSDADEFDDPSEPSDALHDPALHEEIELVGQLVVAATSTPHRLSKEEIDQALGIEEDEGPSSREKATGP